MTQHSVPTAPAAGSARQQVAERCTSCNACVHSCSFLQTYVTPAQFAASGQQSSASVLAAAFECSLCGLCTALCPEKTDPGAMFLEIRREAIGRDASTLSEHAGLLGYERRGTSRLFSWYGLPQGCDTVFFPGCALPGTRPEQTKKVFALLQKIVPNLGIVLDCCTKPSHDLGRHDYFLAMFGEMVAYLNGHGITRVLTACPNCHTVFRTHAPEMTTETIYEVLAAQKHVSATVQRRTVTVHDSCVVRFDAGIHGAVRELAVSAGLTIEEMPHNRRLALCCGEGAGVAARAPHFADAWRRIRQSETAGRPVVTYCAGCAHRLGSGNTISHIVDIILDPEQALSGKAPVSAAPRTYPNRLLLKRHFRKTLPTSASRERTFQAEKTKRGFFMPMLLLCLVIGAVAGLWEWLQFGKRTHKKGPWS